MGTSASTSTAELPAELETLARMMAAKVYPLFPRGKYEPEDLRQEARLSALVAYRSYEDGHNCNLTSFAYRVIRADLFHLLKGEHAVKRGSGRYESSLRDEWDNNPWMVDHNSMFENDVINRVSAEQEIAEIGVSENILVWAQLVADGYAIYEADEMMGFTRNWGVRHVAGILQRHKRRKLKERMAAEHEAAVLARAEKVTRSEVILEARCR